VDRSALTPGGFRVVTDEQGRGWRGRVARLVGNDGEPMPVLLDVPDDRGAPPWIAGLPWFELRHPDPPCSQRSNTMPRIYHVASVHPLAGACPPSE